MMRTPDLLQSFMEGDSITSEQVDELLSNRVKEDLYLEYKAGAEFTKPKDGPKTIRQYLSGFANSEGGLLLVGVNEATWSVDGCAPMPPDLLSWASSCVASIGSMFSPAPKFDVIDHPNGRILVAGALRSPSLVFCIEGGEPLYYFRIHDKTPSAPAYLVSDLVLGRRRGARLGIASVKCIAKINMRSGSQTDVQMRLIFRIENQTIGWADEIRMGALWWRRTSKPDSVINRHMTAYINVESPDPTRFGTGTHSLFLYKQIVPPIEPFEDTVIEISSVEITLSIHNHFYHPLELYGAIYLISLDMAPQWYQLKIRVNEDLINYLAEHGNAGSEVDLPLDSHFVEIEPQTTGRAIVALR